ncbi:MAG: M42 family peptidase [Oscillospiraceae bacterium]|nr:M42 family peptidase [Oscillospiraceae bacterium]
MDLKEKIFELTAVDAPAGSETAAAEKIAAMLYRCTDEMRVDPVGNVLAVKRSNKPDAPVMLIDAHMDEVGFIVTGQEEGFLKFSAIGGVDPRMLPAREVNIMSDPPLYGVIACLPPHVLTAEEREKAVEIKNLYIDAGLTAEEAERLVPPGTPGTFRGEACMLGDGQICSKALDDRSCVAIMIEVAERLKKEELSMDVVYMASVQAELGCRGAVAGAFSAAPDWCIALDVTHAETPDEHGKGVMKLGGGAAIGIGPNMDRKMTAQLRETAAKNGLASQLEVMSGHTGTDAWPIQVSREGVRTAVVSLPLKYMHSPVEVIKLSDAENIADLVTAFILERSADNA